ncbi:unnamed protein product, partial [Polarella glacialis]
ASVVSGEVDEQDYKLMPSVGTWLHLPRQEQVCSSPAGASASGLLPTTSQPEGGPEATSRPEVSSAEVLDVPGNERCFDCDTSCRADAWVSMSHATVICIDCAGVHRSFGVHVSFVRSLALDAMKDSELQALVAGGNSEFQAFLEEPSQNVPRRVWLALPLEVRYHTPAADLYRRRLQARSEGREIEPLPSELRRVPLPPPS